MAEKEKKKKSSGSSAARPKAGRTPSDAKTAKSRSTVTLTAAEKPPARRPSDTPERQTKERPAPPRDTKEANRRKDTPAKQGPEPIDVNQVRPSRAHRFSEQYMPYIWGALALFFTVCFLLDVIGQAETAGEHLMGVVGFGLCRTLFGLFGWAAFLLPVMFVSLAVFWRKYTREHLVGVQVLMSLLFMLLLAGFIHVCNCSVPGSSLGSVVDPGYLFNSGWAFESGGIVGGYLGWAMYHGLKFAGSLVLLIITMPLIVMFLVGVTPAYVFARILHKIREIRAARKAAAEAAAAETAEKEAARLADEQRRRGADAQTAADAKAAADEEDYRRSLKEAQTHDQEPAEEPSQTRPAARRRAGEDGDKERAARPDPAAGEASEEDVTDARGYAGDTEEGAQKKRRPFLPAARRRRNENEAPSDRRPTDGYDDLTDVDDTWQAEKEDMAALDAISAGMDHTEEPDPASLADERDPDENEDLFRTSHPVAHRRRHTEITLDGEDPAGDDPNAVEVETDDADGFPPYGVDTPAPADDEAPAAPVVTQEDPFGDIPELQGGASRVVASDPGERQEIVVRVLKQDPTALTGTPDNPVDGLPDETAALEGADASAAVPAADDQPEEPDYLFPSIEFLTKGSAKYEADEEEIARNIRTLQDTLESFHIRVKEISCSCGPTVTRFEVRPDVGVRVRSIANLVDDIALSLAKAGVRIEAPIPGKAAVGIEVPNDKASTVYFRNLIETPEFQNHKSRIAACLGAEVSGRPVIFDINKMPHLLVAGTTGSGKSVCINSIIMSILYKAKPEEVKLILIDPKKVEFTVYRDLPHLYCPIVTDPKRAAGALYSAVAEMERRYELIEEVGVRNLAGYNEATANDPGKPVLPQIVIIIDELADLMLTAPADVETAICRLAQKARAAGIHLILGTQRPSVDVITGLIKANIPSRIAFTVKSQIDSRTIIDTAGAEKLIGRGDMLYAPVGATKPLRVQGAFVGDSEVERVVDFIKKNNGKAVYDEEFARQIDVEAARCGPKKKGGDEGNIEDFDMLGGGGDEDPKFWEAAQVAINADKVSTSLLQRTLKLGYGRAAKIIDRMEEMGIVGPADGNKPRKILVSSDQLASMKRGEG